MTNSKVDIDAIKIGAAMAEIKQKLLTGRIRSVFVGTIDADGHPDAWWIIDQSTSDMSDALALMDGISADIRRREGKMS